MPAGQDGSDTIDGGAGNDVIAGDNALDPAERRAHSPRDRTLTGADDLHASTNADGTITYLPNIRPARRLDPTGAARADDRALRRAARPTRRSSATTTIAGGAGNDVIFGQMGDDVIQGDGSSR